MVLWKHGRGLRKHLQGGREITIDLDDPRRKLKRLAEQFEFKHVVAKSLLKWGLKHREIQVSRFLCMFLCSTPWNF